MKIICIGRNYVEHAKELNNPLPQEPVYFLKPDSCIINNSKPFFYPEFSQEIHHEIEIVIKINRLGKNIASRFAHRYYNEIGMGIDFTARDIQNICKEKGLPWEKAKAFDGAAPISKFISVMPGQDMQNIDFKLDINGTTVQTGNTKNMIFPINDIISYVSKFMTLKIGDLIFTGTPEGVGPVKIGDHLEGYLAEEKMLDFYIK